MISSVFNVSLEGGDMP